MAGKISHDQNFKNLILDYPRDALAFLAPKQAPAPGDRVRITPLRQEQLKERLGDRFRALDTPLLVEWEDGSRDPVVFAIEQETDPRRFSPHRLLQYCLDLAKLFGTSRVVPVVVFLGAAPPPPAPLVLGTGRGRVLRFDYVACRLADIPADEWLDSDNLVARINLPNMKFPPERRVEIYAAAVRGLRELEPDQRKRMKYSEFIDIYADLDHNERRRFQQEHSEENSIMAGIVSRAREEGIERGMQQGRVEGERSLLERQLRRRFGQLPNGTALRLGRASTTELEAWAENVLEARTLDEVFKTSH